MEYFRILPVEIKLEILIRIPTESILECKLVRTGWRNLVSNYPSFSNMHLKYLDHPAVADSGKLGFIAVTWKTWKKDECFYYIEYNENHDQSTTPIGRIRRINLTLPFGSTSCSGSCNGLICFVKLQSFGIVKSERPFCICNPITREYIVLPEIEIDWHDIDPWTSGFGYVSTTNEYKVVGIRLSKYPLLVEVYVYTLGSGNGWRILGKFNFRRSKYWGPGIFANGAVYWLDVELGVIFTFNLAEEKFSEHLSLPPLPPDSNLRYYRIGNLNGILYIAASSVDEEGNFFDDIWLLKEENHNHDMKEREDVQALGWSKEFRIGRSELLVSTKTNDVLTYTHKHLNVYDTKTSTSKRLVGFKEMFRNVFPHKNTLISLKELGEKDIKIMDSIEVEDEEEEEEDEEEEDEEEEDEDGETEP